MTAPALTPEPRNEETCDRCRGPNLMNWHAPSPLWNAVMRDPTDSLEEQWQFLCPTCFATVAVEKGVVRSTGWCLRNHQPLTALAERMDSRVWDKDRCQWREPSEVSSAALTPEVLEELKAALAEHRAAIGRPHEGETLDQFSQRLRAGIKVRDLSFEYFPALLARIAELEGELDQIDSIVPEVRKLVKLTTELRRGVALPPVAIPSSGRE